MLRLVPVLVLLMVIASCGDDDATNDPEPEQPSAESDYSAVGDTVELEHGITVTLHEIRVPIENPNHANEEGTDVLGLDVELCAGPDMPHGPLSAEPFAFSSRMPDNTQHNVSLGEFDPQFIRSDLTAGECNRGWVTFLYEADERPDLFTYDMTYGETTTNVRWQFSSE